ncbi:MAG: hypothetical protein EOM59_10315 [Clostridia bacterium]|nr:hypothetical protein [Clostridia bacterium]
MNDNDLTIIVSSPDSYRDVFKNFLSFFKLNWPDCPYRLILTTNSDLNIDGNIETILNNSDCNWCKRVLNAVQHTTSPYILTFVDDDYISAPVDTGAVKELVSIMAETSIQYCKRPIKRPKQPLYNKDIYHLHSISHKEPYGLTLGTGFWHRDFLVKQLGDGSLDGWALENKWLKETLYLPNGYFDGCVVDDRDLLNIVHCVSKGQWILKSLKKMKRLGYEVDIGKREILPPKVAFINALKSKIGLCLSTKNRYRIKKILRKLGMEFTTDY